MIKIKTSVMKLVENAKKQMKLLQAYKNNPNFRKTMKNKRN